ncbi:MAG: septum formation inhibitor Maf [Candidatus Kapabacteria bacterium]|nr:septum formation inhibitor Maf [Candidatus Kapabacteria bacterium]
MHLPVPLVLASQSPRRQALMRHVGFQFTSIVPSIDEDAVDTSLPPHEYVRELAFRKAIRGCEMTQVDAIVIGSDTTVVLDDEVLNKPADADDAARMLRRLSGRTHVVHTGLALVGRGKGLGRRVASRATKVTFRELSDEEIAAYVASGSPLDKAGAYGIQDDFGAVFVSHVEGCYYTIVGLPLELLYTELRCLVEESDHA